MGGYVVSPSLEICVRTLLRAGFIGNSTTEDCIPFPGGFELFFVSVLPQPVAHSQPPGACLKCIPVADSF